MKVSGEMKIKEVSELDEEKILKTLMLLAPEFERLNYPKLRCAKGSLDSKIRRVRRKKTMPGKRFVYFYRSSERTNAAAHSPASEFQIMNL